MNELRDIRMPLEPSFPWFVWVVLLVLMMITIWGVVKLLLKKNMVVRQRSEVNTEPEVSPEEFALKALESLTIDFKEHQLEVKQFYVRISEIVRRYLEQKHGVPILEATTSEIASLMSEKAWSKQELIQKFLSLSDLVKFAKITPKDSEIREIMAIACEIIG